MREYWIMMGPKSYLTGVLKRRGGNTQRHRSAEEFHVIMIADIGVLVLQAEKLQALLETARVRESHGRILP